MRVASSITPTISAGSKWPAPIGSQQLGTPVTAYVQQGVLFAVVRAEIDYHKPAVLGDEIEVTVEPVHLRRVRFTLEQDVYRCADNTKLVSAKITVACLTPDGRLTAIPSAWPIICPEGSSAGLRMYGVFHHRGTERTETEPTTLNLRGVTTAGSALRHST